MTLHWWMHWFWVTTLLILLRGGSGTLAAPQSEELQHISTDIQVDQQKHSERQGRAMYFTKTPQVVGTKPPPTNATESNQTTKEIDKVVRNTTSNSTLGVTHPAIQWTPVNTTEIDNATVTEVPNNTTTETNVTVIPIYNNVTETQNNTFTSKKRNLTRPDFVKDTTNVEGVAESRIVTEKPLSLETTFLQTRIPPNIESSRRIIEPNDGGMDTGAIAGIAFATLVLGALAGSTAFVLYRRRYLNKPQTLNDKCSNPDSSGYLDDSTIRDNSEEMYSLDNDSFLNSLEAMTIQNYWTDTVKHTKL
ncbi:uncharacterized protein LOC131845916 [Achroia grisella]|uniref:uncharacterized protein LOC131845916 n=1 Tax=Achroia grisella TaxID=688607 RepID=UPI0027D27DD2|nr:uncharacterized protein LOC131845916 [Achroia grisella]XP_059051058.1 uncharacterized protein LOC131845916 [Achroia grisella]